MKNIKQNIGFFITFVIIVISLMGMFDFKRIEILNTGKYDYIYRVKQEGDSLEVYNYVFGGKSLEIIKSTIYEDPIFKTEEITSYYRNGNVRCYRFYIDNYLRYYRHYNEEGVTTKYDGQGFIIPSDSSYVENIKVNMPYTNFFQIVYPPNTGIVLLKGKPVDNEKERDYDTNPLYDLPIENSKSYYQINYDTPGVYTDVICLLIMDTISYDIEEVRTTFEYIVE